VDDSEINRQRALEEVGRLCRRIAELEREVDDQKALVQSLRGELDEADGRAPGGSPQRLIAGLRTGEKLESLGLLAGGIAHDMNNILGAIMSLASVLRGEMPSGDARRRDIEDILAATRRGRDLTQNLLGFAQEGKNVLGRVFLNDVAKDVLAVLSRTVPRTIAWELDLDDELPPTEGDFGQLSHAVMNVCLNAVEAMPGGGTLSITTRRVYLGLPALEQWPHLAPGTFVMLRVSDTGAGMDEETQRHAFEPFFTTKSREERRGLGLSMVFGTVSSHAGKVDLESAPGKGTTVSLFFPRARSTSVELRRTPRVSAAWPETELRRTVLVVDDEEMMRRAARRALEALGCSVIEARNGAEAIEVLGREGAGVGLVLLDVVMPGMGGIEAFPRLRGLRGDVPILITSGYARDGNVDELLRQGAAGFISKPYDLEKLAAHVQAALKP
jgi:two-component system, cell cycle sensor histidine kinase and response regulator CckA